MRIALISLLLAQAAMALSLSPDSQRQFDRTVKPFLEANCTECHDAHKTRAGFRIDTLGTDFLAGKTADDWKEIYDNIGLGKMPPKKEDRPDEAEARAVTDWIDQEIRNAERAAKNSPGRTRRLNRTEYFNTLRDLFYLDENYVRSLTDELPPDGKLDGFDRVGAALYVDQAQLAKYFELAGRVLSERVLAPQPKPPATVRNLSREMKWEPWSERGKYTQVDVMSALSSILNKKEMATFPTGATIYELKNGGIEYLAGGDRVFIGNHNSVTHGAGDGAGGGAWSNQVSNFFNRATQEGRYRLRFRAGAFAGKGKFAVENVKLNFEFGKNGQVADLDRGSVVIDAPLDQPRDYVMEVYLHPRPEVSGVNRGTLKWNGVPAFVQEYAGGRTIQKGLISVLPDLYDLANQLSNEHYKTANQEARKNTPPAQINEILKSKFASMEEQRAGCVQTCLEAGKPAYVYNPEYDLAAIPRLWIESWEVEGPLVDWPPKGRTELLGTDGEKEIDAAALLEIFAKFLPRAYRRAVESAEVNDWVDWVLKTKADFQLSGLEAVKEGIKAVLCSPGFLLIEEATGDAGGPQPLTDYELASRLSYFLWSTMPDADLFALAAAQMLHEPQTLEAQVRRMIADPRGSGLIQDFTGQWLQVRDFGKTMTDRNQYRTYTDDLRKSEWQEPSAFFGEILRNDRSILNFLDSDFVVIDKTLAEHYGIEGVKEVDGFKKVAVRPEQHRGGVLGMAGVLTYLTDGFRTLPVRRAAYVRDVMWNEPAKPPPPNAGDLPAVKPNLTVRQRLEQHRASASCASCHVRLDPFGIALENYDAIGKWRERQNGEGLRGDDQAPALNVSGALPSGREFHDLAEFKQALLAEKEHFVRGFTKKMLTYALGRSVGAVDRDLVDGVVGTLESHDYRMQALVQAIVASDAFRTK